MSRKRKPVAELYDHSRKSNTVRNFTRIPGSNSLLINSGRVTSTSAASGHSSHVPFEPYNTENIGDHVPSNPDIPEAVGIKLTAKRRYQNTVRLTDSTFLAYG